MEVSLDDGRLSKRCATDGSFSFGEVAPGPHTITAAMPGYLTARRWVEVVAGEVTSVPGVRLLGGDADLNGRIDIADLAQIGTGFNTKPPLYSQADINGDNIVDIYDLVLAGANFGFNKSPWPDRP